MDRMLSTKTKAVRRRTGLGGILYQKEANSCSRKSIVSLLLNEKLPQT